MKTSQVIEEYLLEHQIQGHSPATIRYYRQNLGWFCDFLNDIDINAVTLSSAREYVLNLRERNVTFYNHANIYKSSQGVFVVVFP